MIQHGPILNRVILNKQMLQFNHLGFLLLDFFKNVTKGGSGPNTQILASSFKFLVEIPYWISYNALFPRIWYHIKEVYMSNPQIEEPEELYWIINTFI